MKKILITNSSSFTVGDVAIAECMINQILRIIPDARITIESGNADVHRNYISHPDVKLVQRLFDTRNLKYSRSYFSWSFIKNNFVVISKYFLDAADMLIYLIFRKNISNRDIFDAINEADYIISAGGDALTKNYGFFLRLFSFWFYKMLGKTVVIYASTIGPFTGFSKPLVIACLRKLDLIMARDEKSYNFLDESGLDSSLLKRTADCVILLGKRSTNATEAAIKNYSINNNTIIFFLKTNAFSDVSEGDYKSYLEKIKKTILHLRENDRRVIFFSANNTDYETTKKFLVDYDLGASLINIMDFHADEAKEILSRAGLVVAARMHPVILASTAGVPVIGVSDESKMLEYLKIINIPEMHLKQSNFETDLLLGMISRAIGGVDIKKKLDVGLAVAKELSEKNVFYLNELIAANNSNGV